jgi:hypothetical protein
VFAAAATLLVAAALVGCDPGPPADDPITFAVAGDSLTAWDNQTFPEPEGEFDPITWTHWAIADGLELAGGYARAFATARDVADAMVPVDADVLVVMVGTNDTGVTNTDAVLTSIDDIVGTAAVRAVVISAIPPDDGFADEALAFNEVLSSFASERRWTFVDPWDGMRVEGRWVTGLSDDGIHPNADAARDAAAVLGRAIREAA